MDVQASYADFTYSIIYLLQLSEENTPLHTN